MKIIISAVLSLLAFNANAAVLGTWDMAISAGGSSNCYPNSCDVMPENVTLSIGYDNNPGVPISYIYLFVLEELLDASSVNQSFMVNESNSETNYYVNNFNYFSSRLTNGIDEPLSAIMWLGDARQDDGSLNNVYGGWGTIPLESDALTKTYAIAAPDLEGATITSVEFLLTSLAINIVEPDPFSVEYNYDLTGVFTVNGDVSAVPVPAAVWLFGSGLIGLFGVARRKQS